MRARTAILTSLLLVAFARFADAAADPPSASSLYEGHQWFELRERIQGGESSALYRGAVACAFENAESARRLFQPLLSTNAATEGAFAAHQWLNYAYLRTGQYRHTLAELKAMMALQTNIASLRSALPLFEALSVAPEQTVAKRVPVAIRYKRQMGGFLPMIRVNGHAASYLMDSGANISMISEGEARRTGMKIQAVGTGALKTIDATGGQAGFQIAVADEVAFGGFKIRNVAFMVFPDERAPWRDLSPGERGMLGIPVWLALGTLRIHKDGRFEAGFPAAKTPSEPNLAFDGASPIARVGLGGRQLPVLLDSGATVTDFWPPFVREFPELIKQGKPGSRKLSGVGGSETFATVELPEVTVSIGGGSVVCRPAHVLVKETTPESRQFLARLGWDLPAQATCVTFDFANLTMRLD